MPAVSTKIKEKLYYYLVSRNWGINEEYPTYIESQVSENKHNRIANWIVLTRLNFHYRILRKRTPLLSKSYKSNNPEKPVPEKPVPEPVPLLYYRWPDVREDVDSLCKKLFGYDVISFDIFDTAIYRKVYKPDWVFHIMALEMGVVAFQSMRKKAEGLAREAKYKHEGTREVTLSEIYDVLCSQTNIDRKWMEREIELEIETSTVNPYIHEVYSRMLSMGKRIIFVSDMYLPSEVINRMLKKNGYTGYEMLYLSNEYGVNKGTGKFQHVIRETYPDAAIIHIGDNQTGDVENTEAAGIDAVWNRDGMPRVEEPNMSSLAGAVYKAVINNNMNNGTWKDSLYYDHGFRVGGILALGYCNFINKLVKERKIEKVLFCARDCCIIQKIYDQLPDHAENAYMQTSRYAMLNLTAERYSYDFAGRCIMRYINEYRSGRTLGDILTNCGFDYLVPYLEENDLEQFAFPQSIPQRYIEKFIFDHIDVIKAHNREEEAAAAEYFTSLIGDARKVLVVDIGWTGSCISLFKYFMEKHFPERNYEISGTLLCTSRNMELTAAIEDGYMDSFIYNPLKNLDYAKNIMPGGKDAKDRMLQDRLHLPLECLFTSVEASLLGYKKDPDGAVGFIRRAQLPPNPEEIKQMQAGMLDFIRLFREYTGYIKAPVHVSPYVAFQPYSTSLKYKSYNYAVFKNYVYDTPVMPCENIENNVFVASLYPDTVQINAETQLKEIGQGVPGNTDVLSEQAIVTDTDLPAKMILFITPELTQTGTPRSLLRMAMVAKKQGCNVTIWSEKDGPFRIEYESRGMPVRIVPINKLETPAIQAEIAGFDMAVCNTIVTDAYVRACCKQVPTVWYIREATNIPDFTRSHWNRKYTLQNSQDIYCVSDYAADAIRKFTANEVHVIHNCVEDEVEFASGHVSGTGEKVKFVQFGTMELRKGYDVLIAAYQAMPQNYRDRSELFFAGGFINSGTPYCSYIFSKINADPGIHYLGVVRGEENKIRTLSEMDVVVVASRDESCSLVALEGAMLSKPLIVTENVGAKYIVNENSGFIVKTANVESLKQAMMKMIDQKQHLSVMGAASRQQYEKLANMRVYEDNMRTLYSLAEKKNDPEFLETRNRNKHIFDIKVMEKLQQQDLLAAEGVQKENVIVSLTSHPARITTIIPCIRSLLEQIAQPQKILLWLAEQQFPNREKDLPQELVKLDTDNECFEIRWTEDDMKPHKKYYYAMREYPDLPVIICDDDVIYDRLMVKRLLDSYRRFPHCISAMRTNLITFRPDGTARGYESWIKDYRALRDIPSAQLLPTGIGGVLYPPHSVPEYAFNKNAIVKTCLFCDDLWLKVMTLQNGYKTVLPEEIAGYQPIDGTQDTALWRLNVIAGNNDESFRNIMEEYDRSLGSKEDLLLQMFRDRAV